jgi:DNA repair exonuclease SbcCD ATPase subunit
MAQNFSEWSTFYSKGEDIYSLLSLERCVTGYTQEQIYMRQKRSYILGKYAEHLNLNTNLAHLTTSEEVNHYVNQCHMNSINQDETQIKMQQNTIDVQKDELKQQADTIKMQAGQLKQNKTQLKQQKDELKQQADQLAEKDRIIMARTNLNKRLIDTLIIYKHKQPDGPTYDYQEIKARKQKLHAEFKRLSKLMKLG